MKIAKATTEDHTVLTEITKKSKAYWGYSEKQILKWDNELTISKDYIEKNEVFTLVLDSKIIGYYSYFKDEDRVILDNLFLLPNFIGKGHGRYLMNHFLSRMQEEKIQKVVLYADPNAALFYAKMGFKKIGETATSIKDRFMPIMEMIFQENTSL